MSSRRLPPGSVPKLTSLVQGAPAQGVDAQVKAALEEQSQRVSNAMRVLEEYLYRLSYAQVQGLEEVGSPTLDRGDLIYRPAQTAEKDTRLPIAADGYFLGVRSGLPTWKATAAPSNPTGKTAAAGTGEELLLADATIEQGIVTTKGDLLTHDGSTAERLPAGSDTYVLSAIASESTGLKWVPPNQVTIRTIRGAGTHDMYASDSVVLVDASDGDSEIHLPFPLLG
jgi:hypothetical protein